MRCVPTSGISSSDGAERPEQRADRRDRVHAPGRLARVLDAVQLEPDRPRRDRAEHQHRDRDEREHAEQRAGEGADRDVVERVDRERQQRLRDDRHDREQHGGRQHEHAEAVEVRMPVGQAAAEPVADRERDEHDRDRVRPHDRRVAEERRDQPRDGDLGAERRGPDDEDEQLERQPAAVPHAGVQYGDGPVSDRRRVLASGHGHRRPRRPRPRAPLAPVHPAARVGARGAGDDRARRGLHALRHRRQRLHRRRLLALVHGPRAPPPRDRRRGAGAARPRRALDDARPLAPRRGASSPRASSRSRRPASSASSTPTTARPPSRSR